MVWLCAEYGLFWYLYQDGTIQHEVKLTEILSTNGLSEGEGPQPDYSVLMAPDLYAQVAPDTPVNLRKSHIRFLHSVVASARAVLLARCMVSRQSIQMQLEVII